MRTNAVLTEVRGPAPVNAYGKVPDGIGAHGTLKWSGVRAAYLTRKKKSVKQGEVRNTVMVDVLYVMGTLPIALTPGAPRDGDTLVISDRRPPSTAKRFRVVGVEVKAAGTSVDSVEIELDDERAIA